MNWREKREALEEKILSPFAQLSCHTRGRVRKEEPCPVRTEYQRDRDRIIHSKAFRRLKHKTQVFIAPEGDHFRTRLTHTLEVSQIGRTIARALDLNEDLVEAIALGHDLGHTPYGHAGEEVLRELLPGGFKHNEQSLRVVDKLEGKNGLNLTLEVRDGILNHLWSLKPSTLEGKIVQFADRIAYINHDIDDALRAGILKTEELPQDALKILGSTHSRRINTMVIDLICHSAGKNEIKMSTKVYEATLKMRQFLLETIYVGSKAKEEEGKAKRMLAQLFNYYLEHPFELPSYGEDEDLKRSIADYIAGMTDNYAKNLYLELFVPRGFRSY